MDVRLINNQEQLMDIKEDWKKLQSEGAVKDITTTWEWMSTWWSVFNEGKELAVLVVSNGKEVIGIAPFMRKKVRYFRPIPIKNFPIRMVPYLRLEFIASGDEICSDYLNFIIEDGQEREFLDAIFEFLLNSDHIVWDEILLFQMDAESPFIPLLYDLADKYKLNIEEIDRMSCLYINLPNSFEEYLSQLGQNTRYQIRRGMKKLNEAGNVYFKIAEKEEEIEINKKILIQLHQSRWTQKGKPGRFSEDKYTLYHDKIMSLAYEKNWLRLGVLFLDSKPLACIYNFRFDDKIYSYQAGIEVSESWDLSYGMLVHANAIAHAISEASREYDFLAGTSEYKKRLAKGRREIISLRISKPSSKESVYKAMSKMRETIISARNHFLKRDK